MPVNMGRLWYCYLCLYKIRDKQFFKKAVADKTDLINRCINRCPFWGGLPYWAIISLVLNNRVMSYLIFSPDYTPSASGQISNKGTQDEPTVSGQSLIQKATACLLFVWSIFASIICLKSISLHTRNNVADVQQEGSCSYPCPWQVICLSVHTH